MLEVAVQLDLLDKGLQVSLLEIQQALDGDRGQVEATLEDSPHATLAQFAGRAKVAANLLGVDDSRKTGQVQAIGREKGGGGRICSVRI